MSFDEFKEIDKRDMGDGNKSNEQNVRKCIEMAEVLIKNDSTEDKFLSNLELIYEKYFS